MDKYRITWYIGSVEEVKSEIRHFEFYADDIKEADSKALFILPPKLREKVLYPRILLWEENRHTVDYGSATKFIEITKVAK